MAELFLYSGQFNWNFPMANLTENVDKLKSKLFQECRNHYGDVTETDQELNEVMFYYGGLRLTLNGFLHVKAIFTAYSFELPTTIKSKHQAALSKLEYPYYLTNKRLVLFSSMDAMMVKIHGGVLGFLETCSQLD